VGTDFRSDRMDSAEGRGYARKAKDAWNAYADAVNKVALPMAKPLIDGIAANQAVDLMGFWLVWHLEGGYEGLRKTGICNLSPYRHISEGYRPSSG
jgi:hypothetical protein